MRHPALARSMLAVAFVAVAGSGCDQLFSTLQELEQQQQQRGATTGAAGAPGSGSDGTPGSTGSAGAPVRGGSGGAGPAGASGSSSGSCEAFMGPTGVCKRCYDAAGLLILEDCPPPPPPPSDAATCVSIDDGSPSSCKDLGTWKQYGADRCKQQNLVITNITPGATCADGYYSTVTYTCCSGGSGIDVPPPPKCGETGGPDGQVCKT
jgi:hypothetical protein